MGYIKKGLLIVVLLTNFFGLKAQNPSYYVLGEEALSGVSIFDILQDSSENYWLATNKGVIKYDGHNFKKINAPEAVSNSVFDLQLDYNNKIYCKNLSGQLFQIENDTCKLYFHIPDSLLYKEIYYSFDASNSLVIASGCVFKVTADKKIEILKKDSSLLYHAPLFQAKDSSLYVYQMNKGELRWKNNKLEESGVSWSEKSLVIQYFQLNNKLYRYDKTSGLLLKKEGNSFIFNDSLKFKNDKNEWIRYYSDSSNLWLAKQLGGMLVFDKNLKPLFNGKTVLDNYFISAFHKDSEGNILLGTFGEGLLVIPNIYLQDIPLPNQNEKITRITTTPAKEVFLGTQNGEVFRRKNNEKSTLFWSGGGKNIEVLAYIPESNQILLDNKKNIFIDINTKNKTSIDIGSIKDITHVKKGKYLMATNYGIGEYFPKEAQFESIAGFTGRTNCVSLDTLTQTIYAGTAIGLKIGTKQKSTYFKIKEKPVMCGDLLFLEGKMYATTSKNGVLIFKNNLLVDNWTTKNGLLSNSVRRIKTYHNQLFITTDKGLQVLNKQGKSVFILNKSLGLKSNSIIDFEIVDNTLWMVHKKGVQTINLSHLKPFEYRPQIALSKLYVNDSLQEITQQQQFDFEHKKFEFYVSISTLKYKEEVKLYHQLKGIENTWIIEPYTNNKIDYKSLPPGKYQFKVKAVCRNIESNTVVYSFVIAKPYWQTWWFYLLVGSIVLLIILFLFKNEIKKQKRKIQFKNELNASKLIAIQSQMNPHFIFNAINSIQDLILKEDIENSYRYIVKFAELVRKTLDFSDKEFIDIEEELELLNVYLELEKLRFKDDFEYTITNNLEDIQIPPMLVQPFIENAIKHGLLHRGGLKKLDIVFDKKETVQCTVTDNGVGRKKAQEIKARQLKNHISFSVNATNNRFKIMQSHYQQKLGVVFIDLTDNEEAKGTKVIINMPFKQSY